MQDDPENPQNWSSAKKLLISFEIWLVVSLRANIQASMFGGIFTDSSDGSMYSFAVYFGSSVYTSSIDGIMEEFDNIGIVTASLGFALYVLACMYSINVTLLLTHVFRWYRPDVVVTFERVICACLLAPGLWY